MSPFRGPSKNSDTPAAAHPRRLGPPAMFTWQSHASLIAGGPRHPRLHHIRRTDHFGRTLAARRQQGVALEHGLGDVDHATAAPAGVLAQQLEGPAVADLMALHENALGAFDDRAPVERGLELGHLLVDPLLLAMTPQRDLDGGLH